MSPRVRLLCVLVLAAVGLAVPAPARAHADLVSTFPSADSEVAAPALIGVEFDEAVRAAPDALTLTRADGSPVAIGDVESHHGGRAMQARVLGEVGPGEWRVRWRVLSEDDHLEEGAFGFVVAAPAAPEVAPEAPTPQHSASSGHAADVAAALPVAVTTTLRVVPRLAKASASGADRRNNDLGFRPFVVGAAAALGAMAIATASARSRRRTV